MRYNTISAIGTFTALTAASTDYLLLDPSRCDGGDDAPLRVTEEQAPGQDGALILPAFDDVWIITLGGDLIINSAGDESGFLAAQDTLLASLKTALDLLKAAPDDLVHSAGSLKVWKHDRIAGSWSGITKSVTFALAVDVFA